MIVQLQLLTKLRINCVLMTQVVCDLFQHLKLISLASLIFQGLIFNP